MILGSNCVWPVSPCIEPRVDASRRAAALCGDRFAGQGDEHDQGCDDDRLELPALSHSEPFHALSIRRSTGSTDRLAEVGLFSSANELQQQSTDFLRPLL